MAETKSGFWRTNNPLMWAAIATAMFFAVILALGFSPTCNADLFPKGDCPAKWRHLRVAPFNVVGDTLAGIAGVLAFIWLIAAVLLQSIELGEQRKVLEEQRLATEKMAGAQEDQVTLLQKQSDVLNFELQDRREERARKLLNVQLRSLSDLVDLEARQGDLFAEATESNETLFSERRDNDVDVHIFINRDAVGAFFHRNESLAIGTDSLLAGAIDPYFIIVGLCQEIARLEDELPEDQLARLSYMKFSDFSTGVHRFVEHDIWADQAHDPSNPTNFLERPY